MSRQSIRVRLTGSYPADAQNNGDWMMNSKTAVAIGLALASGVAIACTMKPMPPLVVKVSIVDVVVAAFQGYDNPSRAAALNNLDEAASDLVGESNWQANNYVGSVTYRVGNGTNIVTENKPCNQKAIDSLPDPDEDEDAEQHGQNGGSGSYAGYIWFGARIYGSGTCIYNCGGTVTVGEVDPQ